MIIDKRDSTSEFDKDLHESYFIEPEAFCSILNDRRQYEFNDACFSFFVLLLSLMYNTYSGRDCSIVHYRTWINTEIGFYAFNILFCYIYYQNLKMRRRENVSFMLFNCFLNVIHTGWLIYGNVIFYKYRVVCEDEMTR